LRDGSSAAVTMRHGPMLRTDLRLPDAVRRANVSAPREMNVKHAPFPTLALWFVLVLALFECAVRMGGDRFIATGRRR